MQAVKPTLLEANKRLPYGFRGQRDEIDRLFMHKPWHSIAKAYSVGDESAVNNVLMADLLHVAAVERIQEPISPDK